MRGVRTHTWLFWLFWPLGVVLLAAVGARAFIGATADVPPGIGPVFAATNDIHEGGSADPVPGFRANVS